jgi:2-keto-4-pentenoate hydratase/2-oxohepta-3-ene-1,7-dioic acid hydratase in catechol pathway
MRLASIAEADGARVALIADERVLPLAPGETLRAIAAEGPRALTRIAAWADVQPDHARRRLDEVRLGPAVPDPGAIYTVGRNYRDPARPGERPPERPLVYGKASSSVTGPGSPVAWDRSLTAHVNGECELGVVIGAAGSIFGYTIVNDVTSSDPWLDGDQWLLGKSMPGFCPVGPWIVTADELDPGDLRLRFTVNGVTVQDGRTSEMRVAPADVIAYLRSHVALRPGDLIATGTPARIGPDAGRYLQAGDVMTASIEGIGELTNPIG